MDTCLEELYLSCDSINSEFMFGLTYKQSCCIEVDNQTEEDKKDECKPIHKTINQFNHDDQFISDNNDNDNICITSSIVPLYDLYNLNNMDLYHVNNNSNIHYYITKFINTLDEDKYYKNAWEWLENFDADYRMHLFPEEIDKIIIFLADFFTLKTQRIVYSDIMHKKSVEGNKIIGKSKWDVQTYNIILKWKIDRFNGYGSGISEKDWLEEYYPLLSKDFKKFLINKMKILNREYTNIGRQPVIYYNNQPDSGGGFYNLQYRLSSTGGYGY